MPDFEEIIQKALDDRLIPGVVMLAHDKSGKLNYAKALGSSSFAPGTDQPDNPMRLDSVFELRSMTKLPTTIAVLQLVERGLVGLDDDVTTTLLPELGVQPIISGFETGQDANTAISTLEPRQSPITLRQLLTHCAGTGYWFLDETLGNYFQVSGQGSPMGATVEERFAYPLLFQPGEGWLYGSAIDWAGRLVERVTGRTLQAYMEENVFAPVGIRDGITFFPDREDPEMAGRMVTTAVRDPDSLKVGRPTARAPGEVLPPATACLGGEGLFADHREFIKIMRSLLVDDEKLLKKETAAMMFRPQLPPRAKEALLANVANPGWIVGNVPPTGEYDWGFGGLLVDGDSHERRRKGYLYWSGVLNMTWFIDRAAGICGIFATQLLPSGDAHVRPLMDLFEKEMYSRAQQSS